MKATHRLLCPSCEACEGQSPTAATPPSAPAAAPTRMLGRRPGVAKPKKVTVATICREPVSRDDGDNASRRGGRRLPRYPSPGRLLGSVWAFVGGQKSPRGNAPVGG